MLCTGQQFGYKLSHKCVLWVAASDAISRHKEKPGFSPWPVIVLNIQVIHEMSSSNFDEES
jgi:hypothetical protein